MAEWAPKRFWKTVTIAEEGDAFAVRLDERAVRTPGKRLLAVPTRVMADRIAAEWEAQVDTIDPLTMPWTRSANSALDKVATQMEAVIDHLTEYGGTDLLCYRDDAAGELRMRQADAWDPYLDELEARHGVRLSVTHGVMPVAQTDANLNMLRDVARGFDAFQLTGFHDLVTLSGSFVLGLSVAEGRTTPESAWTDSRVDEDYQSEIWGADEEAAELAESKRKEFLHAASFFGAAQNL